MHLRVFRLKWSSHEHIKFLAPVPGKHGGLDTYSVWFCFCFYFRILVIVCVYFYALVCGHLFKVRCLFFSAIIEVSGV